MKNYKVDIYNSLSTEAKIKYLESLGDNYHELDGIDCDNYYLIDGHRIIVVESFPCLIPSSYHEIELPKYF